MIGERLFDVFDINKDGYLDITEFILSMFKLYSTDFNVKMKFVFDMYDFDKDGVISKDDVVLVLSHVPLERNKNGGVIVKEGKVTQSGGCVEDYADRAATQKELHKLVDLCFKDKDKMNLNEFKNVAENVTSEMFLCLFSLVKMHFPLLAQFKNYEQRIRKQSNLLGTPTSSRRLAAPRVLSTFSSTSKIMKFSTPKLTSRPLRALNSDSTEEEKEPVKLPYFRKITSKPKSGFAPNPAAGCPISPAVRLPNTKVKLQDVTKSPTTFLCGKSSGLMLFCECGNTISNFDKLLCDECILQNTEETCEGYLYVKEKEAVRYWFCIDKKDMYCYKDKNDTAYKSMSSLVGCFVKEEASEEINGMVLSPFSVIISQSKSRKYYAEREEDRNMWVTTIKKVIGYANITDYYELKENLGKGKFGLVRSAVHKKSGKKVAIKLMKKLMMTPQDLELVKQEIEIMKMLQHPNLIRLLDVFENTDYIYIVMEIMEGGDLFSYLEKKHFRLPEITAARLVHSLAAGLYYLHNFGIVHRDLKPENVLMVSKAEDSDVKIMDFGLSKMIGPSQLCTEPFGTLSYVSPEVLQQKPYGKGVDVWSLGVLAYLMLVGSLPFDSEDDREVAR
jgi:Ca2+-binding EF-hand superfamily protein